MKSNNNKNTNNMNKTKPVTTVVSFVVSGKDLKGNSYNADSAKELVAKMAEIGVFDMLSVMTVANRSLITGKEDAKGQMKLASISSYNAEEESMELTFFGRNTEYADNVAENLVVIPRVRTDRNTGKVTKIIDFEVVNPMDA